MTSGECLWARFGDELRPFTSYPALETLSQAHLSLEETLVAPLCLNMSAWVQMMPLLPRCPCPNAHPRAKVPVPAVRGGCRHAV